MRILCKLIGHNWDSFRGFEEIYPSATAVCIRCTRKYKHQTTKKDKGEL